MNPQMFGRYLLLDKVAAGGMAEVWRGKITGEANFQRIVAIKKILPHVSEDEDFITMFTDEALITASLVHANIGQVYEFSKVGDVFYIAMEYISGKDLKSLWSWSKARGQIMPIELAAFIVMRMCDGLEYAHSRRDNTGNPSAVVHRDISPQNVLISWEGDVKVIDFGIAKATEKSGKTRPGTLKGKFAYMAPEQIRGLPLDGRSDIFAIGVVLYELCTGQRGFQADSEFSLLEMVRNVEIRPPTLLNQALPPEMERIIYKALAKDRDQRYLSCADMSEDLQRFLLMRGKPPQARDLAAFMRENFTVDWEKERARLESYREVNPKDFAGSGPQPASPGPASPPLSIDIEDDDLAFSSTNATPSASQAQAPAPAPPSLPPGVIRPAAAVAPVASHTQTNAVAPAPAAPPPSSPKTSKLLAAALGGTVVLGGVAFGLWSTVLQPTSTVVVTVTGPGESTVRLDGLPVQKAAPSVSFEKIGKGSHTIVVEAAGYNAIMMPLTTTGEPVVEVKPVLKRVAGKLMVTSEPSGAAITLDGAPTGKQTPATFELEGDSVHEIRLTLKDYKELSKAPVRVAGGQETIEKLVLKPSTVHIRVFSTPEGASVKVGDIDFGLTPADIERAPDEPYPQVVFTKPGCETLTTTVPFDREKAEDRFEVNLKCK